MQQWNKNSGGKSGIEANLLLLQQIPFLWDLGREGQTCKFSEDAVKKV